MLNGCDDDGIRPSGMRHLSLQRGSSTRPGPASETTQSRGLHNYRNGQSTTPPDRKQGFGAAFPRYGGPVAPIVRQFCFCVEPNPGGEDHRKGVEKRDRHHQHNDAFILARDPNRSRKLNFPSAGWKIGSSFNPVKCNRRHLNRRNSGDRSNTGRPGRHRPFWEPTTRREKPAILSITATWKSAPTP